MIKNKLQIIIFKVAFLNNFLLIFYRYENFDFDNSNNLYSLIYQFSLFKTI